MTNSNQKVIIFSAPSGSGKTTIVQRLLEKFPKLKYSISATTRPPRGQEVDGREYYFISADEFRAKIAANEFLEWEEVYANRYYGTPRSELIRIWDEGGVVLFDVDVKGGMNIKRQLGNAALAVFIMPPSIEELRRRLESRGTDSAADINLRIERAEEELSYSTYFDKVVVNDKLDDAIAETERLVADWINDVV